MSDRDDIFYRIGFALEEARSGAPLGRKLPSLGELSERMHPRKEGGSGDSGSGDEGSGDGSALLRVGSEVLAVRLLALWPRRHDAGALGLVRAAAAGLGATVLMRAVRPLLRPDPIETGTAEALAEGVARGLLYAAVVEPRLPLPTLARGAVFGTAGYLVSPWGGLTRVLRKVSPLRKVPLLGGLLEGGAPDDEGFVEHVAFAVAVAVLYEVTGGASGDADG